jgi:hypothetical protein
LAIACAQAQAEEDADAAGTQNIDLDQGARPAATLLIDERAARPGVFSRMLVWWTASTPTHGQAEHLR